MFILQSYVGKQIKGQNKSAGIDALWPVVCGLDHGILIFSNSNSLMDIYLLFFPSFIGSVLNYSNDDGNINMLPLLKRIIQNHIPVWIFRYLFVYFLKQNQFPCATFLYMIMTFSNSTTVVGIKIPWCHYSAHGHQFANQLTIYISRLQSHMELGFTNIRYFCRLVSLC